MTTAEEIGGAIHGVDARIEELREQIMTGEETALLGGVWRVRDALSHLAARANGVARVVQRAERAAASGTGAGAAPMGAAAATAAPRSIDEINAGQVEERAGRSAGELLDEIRSGHEAAIAAARALPAEMLQRVLPLGFRPGDATVGELIVMGGPGHDATHVEQIAAALNAARA